METTNTELTITVLNNCYRFVPFSPTTALTKPKKYKAASICFYKKEFFQGARSSYQRCSVQENMMCK